MGGGGNTLLSQLEKAHINWQDIKDIFVTHKHIDHLMGIIWMIRMIGQHMSQGKYQGEVRIYAHKELIDIDHANDSSGFRGKAYTIY